MAIICLQETFSMGRAPLLLLLLLPLLHSGTGFDVHQEDPSVGLETHPCARPCEAGRPMTCRYDFYVENYHSMSKACFGCPWNQTDCARPHCIAADGVSRALVVVNRQLPGPSLQVCLGDRVEVKVHNHMPEQSTSIHWHGLHQRGSPYMDGVPYVTQCPIPPHSTFRYSFYANNAGTHFWHSHTGCQRADGAVGMLTVRVPVALDPHAGLYDEDRPEHGLLVFDWTHQLAASKFLAHHHAGDDNKADSVLINGKGVYRRFTSGTGDQRQFTFTPREVFSVQKGLRYRFRLVNAGFLNCPLELTVDNHTLLVVASDGFDIKPVRVHSLVSYAGERWDVVVEADQAVDSYWVRLRGLLDCGPRRAHEAAILRYDGADPDKDPSGPTPAYDAPRRTGLQVNSLNRGSSDPETLTAAELRSLPSSLGAPGLGEDPALKERADVQLFVSYDFYALDNPLIHRAGLYGIAQVSNSPHRVFTPQLNHVSLRLPPFPLLPGRDRLHTLAPGSLCNESSLLAEGRDCRHDYCECTHVVNVPLGGVLEIVLVDQGERYDANHPFHLHGHAFRVVSLEKLGTNTSVEEVQRLDAEGGIHRNLVDPPIKDTVTVPDGGYTVLRVLADNPGYWLFHCHIEFHVELGMALVIKVGEHEDMAPVPHGFPQCGDWASNDWLGGEPGDLEEDPVPNNHIHGARALPGVAAHEDLRASNRTEASHGDNRSPGLGSAPRNHIDDASRDPDESNKSDHTTHNTTDEKVFISSKARASEAIKESNAGEEVMAPTSTTKRTPAVVSTVVTSVSSTTTNSNDEDIELGTTETVNEQTTLLDVSSEDFVTEDPLKPDRVTITDMVDQKSDDPLTTTDNAVESTVVDIDMTGMSGSKHVYKYDVVTKSVESTDKQTSTMSPNILAVSSTPLPQQASTLSEFIMRVNPRREGGYRSTGVELEYLEKPDFKYNVVVMDAETAETVQPSQKWSAAVSAGGAALAPGLLAPIGLLALCFL